MADIKRMKAYYKLNADYVFLFIVLSLF